MTIVFVTKLEVVCKQVGGCLISHNLQLACVGRAVRVAKNNMNNEHAKTQCIVHILVKKEHSAMEPGIERLNSINMALTAIDSFNQPNRSLFNLQRACTELVSSHAMVT